MFGDLMRQEVWGASTLLWIPAFHLTIVKTTPLRADCWGSICKNSRSSMKERLLSGDWGSARETSLNEMAPATCWFKTNRKKGNSFKKWIWGFSSSCQGSRIPRVFLCPFEFLGHVQFQSARSPLLLLIALLGAMGWFSGILLMERKAKLMRLDSSSFCEPPTLSTDTVPVAGKSSRSWQRPCHLGRNWVKSSKPSKTEQSRALSVLKSRFSTKDLGRASAGLGPG